ncbi:Ketopantoate reductase ApbA/PanE [Penicillium brevicompactum]|uniref:Ketopantoate reductase ApbA/PanE n=1 Tax=Penicillium brevicompactum TaxID=5074 RepID=UPI0025420F1F|nr:Ketopantoate reductase ApbA/PanE [Penicillium brevicompactum]KAJ5347545.1 Ketopantoate reductase ApbA/PanE [Penicillium brevicompactum]
MSQEITGAEKRRMLVVGSGGVGTMVSVALERSSMASVTAVLRSNYQKVIQDGFDIQSIDHGKLTNWRPSAVVNSIPMADPNKPFDYLIITMKNIPEVNNIPKIIAPAVTPDHTTIVLFQNGMYIEPPIIEAFPSNVVLSAPSYIGAHEDNGHVIHDDHDTFHIGVFHNKSLDKTFERAKLEEFANIYNGSKVVDANIVDDIVFYRWRKLLWNGIFNPMCAITQLDSAAIRTFGGEHSLIRPGMAEMASIAQADGYDLGPNIVDEVINNPPLELSFRPSMLVDVDKGNPIEVEVILGNALRVAREKGVQTPLLDTTYRFLKLTQARLLAARGLIVEPKELPTADLI